MLDELERSILEKLTFEEHFHHLLEEVDTSRPILSDILKAFLVKELVQAFYKDEETELLKPTAFCDTDNLQDYQFRRTKKGTDALYGMR